MITNVRKGEELDSKKLSEYLTKVTERNFENPEIFQFSGGYSNLTYLIRSEDLQLVLRKPPKGANIKSGHDMSREFQVLSALYPEDIKVPQPLYFCDDREVLGSDFYIMEYVDGLVLRADIPSDKFPEPSK
jgi:aminoglycoside phosphotransferase (APT) family kinase protein